MAVSAKIFEIKKYPSEFPIETVPTNTGIGDDFQLKTTVEYLGKGEYKEKDLTKLLINHDKGTKFKGIGYSEELGRISDIISIAEEREFPAFVFPEKDYILAAYSTKEIFNQSFKRLRRYGHHSNNEGKNLIADPIKLDMQKLKASFEDESEAPVIRGGWFRELRITNVEVAYIGGGGVDDSEEWEKYETKGKISSLRLDYPNPDFEEEPYKFLLTWDGSLYSYKNFSENEFLQIVIPIFEYIIKFKEN